jgi:hypothetical protein
MALKCDVQYVNAREGLKINYGLPRQRKKPYINNGIPPEHRRSEKKQTVLNFTKNNKEGKQQGAAPITSGNEAVKQTPLKAQLSKYEI